MGLAIGLALVTAVLAVIPFLFSRMETGAKAGMAGIGFVVVGIVSFLLYYSNAPSLAAPFWGSIGIALFLWWGVASAVIEAGSNDSNHLSIAFPAVLLVLMIGRGCTGSDMLRADDYATMIGKVEERVWTQDIQPKDPRHIRMVPLEMAQYLADKQLGSVEGAIGSQFQVSDYYMTLQRFQGELWYVAPLDYKGFSAWTATQGAPGYVMVHAEDPTKPSVVHTGDKYLYTPGAYFGNNLDRHLWSSGYSDKWLTDYNFELDEEGKAWWVVTVSIPTIAWWGEKVEGALLVDPSTGSFTFYALGSVPDWVDRVLPKSVVEKYITWRGVYHAGWWNSFWAEKNVTKPEGADIIYGSDDEPYWVTGITSNNYNDNSVVGYMYVDSRTGKSVYYRAQGSTDEAVLDAVNNRVHYKKWHGASPILYNIYGTMAEIVPLLGESHTFQGVAIVNIETLQIAEGTNQHTALREYQKLLSETGQQIAPELQHEQKVASGRVERIAAEVKGGETLYYVLLERNERLFTGASELSPELPLSRVGDTVTIGFVDSSEDVEPMLSFDNQAITLQQTSNQQTVRSAASERQSGVREEKEERTLDGEFENLSPEQKREALRRARQQ